MVVLLLLSRLCVRTKLCFARKPGVLSYAWDSLLWVMGNMC